MASNWPSCISPCKNTRNDSWSCCSLIGHKKTKVLWHQSEARTTPTVWNWSGKTVSPGAPRFVLYFSSPKFFFARYDFPSPPLTAPGSPRMMSHELKDQKVSDTEFNIILNELARYKALKHAVHSKVTRKSSKRQTDPQPDLEKIRKEIRNEVCEEFRKKLKASSTNLN